MPGTQDAESKKLGERRGAGRRCASTFKLIAVGALCALESKIRWLHCAGSVLNKKCKRLLCVLMHEKGVGTHGGHRLLHQPLRQRRQPQPLGPERQRATVDTHCTVRLLLEGGRQVAVGCARICVGCARAAGGDAEEGVVGGWVGVERRVVVPARA